MDNPILIPRPFAQDGSKNIIEDVLQPSQSTGAATWQDGFNPITSTPPAAGGIAPDRMDFNGIFYAVSAHSFFQQGGGVYKFNHEYVSKVGGYPKGSILMSNDDAQEFISLVDGNGVDFNNEDYSGKWNKYADVEGLKQQSILTYPATPTSKQGDLIYVDPFGLMKWNGSEYVDVGVDTLQNSLIGVPIPYPSEIPPVGYVVMQGQSFNPTTYPKLAQLYTSNTLPDLRGEFIRGWDNGRGIDVGRELLSSQLDALQNITGAFDMIAATELCSGAMYNGGVVGTRGSYGETNTGRRCEFNAARVVRTATETRSRNISFNYICLTGEK